MLDFIVYISYSDFNKEGIIMNFSGLLKSFISLMNTFGIADLLDVSIVAFIIYSLIKVFRETRAEQLVKGIVVLLIGYILSHQFNLKMLSTILDSVFQFSVIALIVVFQPELRRTLEQIGRSKLGDYWSFSVKETEEYIQAQKRVIKTVTEASMLFKESKTGALMVFERKTKLGEIIDTGTIIKAKPSVAILGNIFYNKAPLHDGAMILRDGIIYAAGCILPLTHNEDVNIDLGTRHRAAIGMSENSDAIIVVVSEETGSISIAINGILKRNYNRETLENELEELILPDNIENNKKKLNILNFRKERKNEEN